MKRCDMCGRPFGLIRHYHYSRQFCSTRCKSRFIDRKAQQTARRRGAIAQLMGFAATLRERHQA